MFVLCSCSGAAETGRGAEGRPNRRPVGGAHPWLPDIRLQQDLALVALLGLPHVERNGHHLMDGFAGRPKAEAARFMAAHPDLRADTARGPRLRLRDGAPGMGSLDVAGLGAAGEPGFAAMETMPRVGWP